MSSDHLNDVDSSDCVDDDDDDVDDEFVHELNYLSVCGILGAAGNVVVHMLVVDNDSMEYVDDMYEHDCNCYHRSSHH